MNLVQLVSFGCGVDAITTDEVREILESKDKIYTQIKIDEITNLGAVRIRLRSACSRRSTSSRHSLLTTKGRIEPMPSNHVEFTREMREAGYTILVPNMLEFHFSLIVKVLRLNGYNAELLTNSGPNVMAEGLKYVHNDTCVPALLVIGQFLDALHSGKYDVDRSRRFACPLVPLIAPSATQFIHP